MLLINYSKNTFSFLKGGYRPCSPWLMKDLTIQAGFVFCRLKHLVFVAEIKISK